jgi:hypothetical protein
MRFPIAILMHARADNRSHDGGPGVLFAPQVLRSIAVVVYLPIIIEHLLSSGFDVVLAEFLATSLQLLFDFVGFFMVAQRIASQSINNLRLVKLLNVKLERIASEYYSIKV